MKNLRSTFCFFLPLAIVLLFPVASFAENLSDPLRERSIQEKREDIISRALDTAMNARSGEQAPAVSKPANGPAPVVVPSTPQTAPLSGNKWTEGEAAEDLPAIELKTQEVQFGTELYRYSYKEPVFNLEIKGLQYGIFGAYIYRPPRGDALRSEVVNMYKLDARFVSGAVDYSSDPSGQLDNEDNYAFEIRGVAGCDHFVNDQFLLTGYGGFGFRYLNNDSGGRQSTTGAYGYERVSNYFYLPIGVETLNQITPRWKVAANLEWDIFLYGEQTSYLSDVNSGDPDPENNQNRGYGVRGSTKIIKEGESVNLFFEPFFRYWRIHDSEVTRAVGNTYVVSGLEPDNNTTEYGVKFGLQY